MVRKLDLHFPLGKEDQVALLALPADVKRLQRHAYIVRQGDVATHSCVLLKGVAVRCKYVARGRRQICAIHIRGELVDLQNSLLIRADHCVQTVTEATVAFIPREEMQRIASERVAVGKALWKSTLIDASIYLEWLANNGQRSARARLGHLFCEFALRLDAVGLGQRSSYELPMTQEELAEATGLTPVHVNRTIRQLQAEGLIERSSARSIQIGDWHRLAKMADFDPLYLHLPG